jgi:hypothetical protein
MKISKLDFFIVQAKINTSQKPEGIFKLLSYAFSKHNSMNLPDKINNLSKELVKKDIESENSSSYFDIPREYSRLFSLYLRN